MAYSTYPMLSHAKQNSLLVKQRTVTGGQAIRRKRCATFCPVSKVGCCVMCVCTRIKSLPPIMHLQVSLVRPVAVENSKHKPLLLYLPGKLS